MTSGLLITLAVDGPVRLMTGNEPVARAGAMAWWVLPAFLVGAVVLALLTWFVIDRRARVERSPAEYAFRALSLRMGMGAWRATLLRKLAAAHGTATPVSLLLSNHALGMAAAEFEKTADARSIKKLARLMTLRGMHAAS